MLNKIYKFYLYILGLTDKFELRCKKFFFSGRFFTTNSKIRRQSLELLNINTAKLALLIEKYYHGYSNYTRGNRLIMHRNLAEIESCFLEFSKSTQLNANDILAKFGIRFNQDEINRLMFLKKISLFLKPGSKLVYEAGVAFGQLLQPEDAIKTYDCNQICTLYLHLYCLEYDANDLRIKLPKDHVCLHFKGLDIEATNGEFLIDNETTKTFPITELLAVNLLDVSDLNYHTTPISPKAFYKMMSFAKRISQNPVIEDNMQTAYKKMSLFYIHKSAPKNALFFIEKIIDKNVRLEFIRQISDLYLQKNKFKKSLYYANIAHNSGQTKHIYTQMYNKLVVELKNVKTISDAKRHKATYKRMLKIARKLKDNNLINNIKDTLSKL